jgi:hypothetical protein
MSKCKSCEFGDKPMVVDIDGVLCSVSGNQPYMIAHAYEEYWWRCRNAPRKNSRAWRDFVQQAAGMPLETAPDRA